MIATKGLMAVRASPANRTKLVARSSPEINGAAPTAVKAPSVESTLSALDALLPESPKPEPAPKPAATTPASRPAAMPSFAPVASTSASTSGRSSPARGQKFDFSSVMGFSGLAPEVINARAAMIGFLAALTSELGNGESVFAQCVSGGAAKAGLVILAVTLASFAPALRQVPWDAVFGKDKKPREFGPFTPTAELINGRAAMLGLATMIFIEGASNQAFFF